MKKAATLFLAVLLLQACNSKHDSQGSLEASIINDAFLDMIDTVAYKYHTLRPAPNFDVFTDRDSLTVAIAPVLSNIRERTADINSIISEMPIEDRKKIGELFKKSETDSAQVELPWKQIGNTGRYKLFPHSKQSGAIDTLSAIGKVLFSRVYFDETYAILVATIRAPTRVGVVKLFVLKNTGGKWRKKDEYELEIW
ncbi:hypothetical protein GWC95_13185 [Sediminibacterium roseum]|uniref:Uncharacterized protein n=1 Tax=Sediminibacterium roseum TaxID=1978412 RepID=A0ABX0A154_9BACT|nr:hypothetical protein [Sediminibacterium roseum]NCI50886.1 hypothetical protein [Sediminibacterium roseum]